MEVKEVFKDIAPLKQWCLVNQNKQGRAVDINPIDGTWEQLYKADKTFKGISPSKPRENWLTYEEAKEALKELKAKDPFQYSQIGLIVYKPLAVIDLDDSILADGSLTPFAAKILSKFPNTFVELSRSGKGLHIYCLFNSNPFPPRNKVVEGDNRLEVYTSNKVVIMTGKAYGEVKPLTDYTQELLALDREYFAEPEAAKPNFTYSPNTCAVVLGEISKDDKRVIAYLERAIEDELNILGELGKDSGRHNRLLSSSRQLGKLANYFTPQGIEEVKARLREVYLATENTSARAQDFEATFKDGWTQGAANPRTINFKEDFAFKPFTQKPTRKEPERLKVTNLDAQAINNSFDTLYSFLLKAVGAASEGDTLETISASLNLEDKKAIRERFNLGYYDSSNLGSFGLIPAKIEKGIVIPVYSPFLLLAGIKVANTNDTYSLGCDCSPWVKGADSDCIVVCNTHKEALNLAQNLNKYTSVVAIGKVLDVETYKALSRARAVIAVGNKAFTEKVSNTFANCKAIDSSARGKLWKWVEALLVRLGVTPRQNTYILPSGIYTDNYQEYIRELNNTSIF
mgnify:CR=1 FL=1